MTSIHVGVPVSLALQALGADGVAQDRAGAAILTLSDAAALVNGADGAPLSGGAARFRVALTHGHASLSVTFETPGNQQAFATLADDLETAGQSADLTVDDVLLTLDTPADATVGTAQAVTVTARDEAGQPLADYVGTVVLSASDANAQIGAAGDVNPLASGATAHQFTPSDAGRFTTQVTFAQPGDQSLVATDARRSCAARAATWRSACPLRTQVPARWRVRTRRLA